MCQALHAHVCLCKRKKVFAVLDGHQGHGGTVQFARGGGGEVEGTKETRRPSYKRIAPTVTYTDHARAGAGGPTSKTKYTTSSLSSCLTSAPAAMRPFYISSSFSTSQRHSCDALTKSTTACYSYLIALTQTHTDMHTATAPVTSHHITSHHISSLTNNLRISYTITIKTTTTQSLTQDLLSFLSYFPAFSYFFIKV